jgi:hypothetical protein
MDTRRWSKYGRDWVRGRFTRIRQTGARLDYEAALDNGQRGILPARMLRKAAGT